MADKQFTEKKGPYFLGIHAGQGFARASLVNEIGELAKGAVEPTQVFRDGVFYEQSTDNIWLGVTQAVRKVMEGIDVTQVKGIGIVATPSLVCVDDKGNPVTVSVTRKPERNAILYYDQRAALEAETVNKTNHNILKYFGGKTSTDLHETKLMWLKNHLKDDCWSKAGFFFDLPDFLTWRATGSEVRSSCLTKWSYLNDDKLQGWDDGFLKEIGLEDLITDGYKKLGKYTALPGSALSGLSKTAAMELGLSEGTPVGVSMEHTPAAGLALLGCTAKGADTNFTNRLCLVCGTFRTSHFVVSKKPSFIQGVTGPLKDNIVPGMYLSMAQQGAGAALIDQIINSHAATKGIKKHLQGKSMEDYLYKIVRAEYRQSKKKATYLAKNIHILPDFNGNITPFKDPEIRGMISGLGLSYTQESLGLLYLATVQSLAYSTRRILNLYQEAGHDIKYVVIGGELGHNVLFTKVHKNALKMPVIVPDQTSLKTIGAAILGAVASKHFDTFEEAVKSMACKASLYIPQDKELYNVHEKKFKVFLKMYDHQMEYRKIMM